ncbi:hypothetical protein IFM89_023893, partial [Coptis chinensis]
AVKDDIGTILIQRPHKGPFYVSPKSIDQLIANLGIWSRLFSKMWYRSVSFLIHYQLYVIDLLQLVQTTEFYKYASMGFTVVGVFRLLNILFDTSWKEGAVLFFEIGSDEKTDNGPESAKKERLMLDLCVICLEHEYNVVFVP